MSFQRDVQIKKHFQVGSIGVQHFRIELICFVNIHSAHKQAWANKELHLQHKQQEADHENSFCRRLWNFQKSFYRSEVFHVCTSVLNLWNKKADCDLWSINGAPASLQFARVRVHRVLMREPSREERAGCRIGGIQLDRAGDCGEKVTMVTLLAKIWMQREEWEGGGRGGGVCSVRYSGERDGERGVRVNMNHCSRLIFHQTTRSVQCLPTDAGHYRWGGRRSRKYSREEQDQAGGRFAKLFAERKDVFSPLLKEMGDRRRRMSGEINEEKRGRGGRVTGRTCCKTVKKRNTITRPLTVSSK